MQKTRTLWLKLINLGIEDESSSILRERVRLVNILSFTGIALALIFGLYATIADFQAIVYSLLFTLIAYSIQIWLNTQQQYRLASFLFLVSTNLLIFFSTYAYGKGSMIQLFFIPLAALPFLMFNNKSWKSLVITALIPLMGYLTIELIPIDYTNPLHITSTYPQLLVLGNITITTIVTVFIVYFFAKSRNKAQQIMELLLEETQLKNDVLLEQSKLVKQREVELKEMNKRLSFHKGNLEKLVEERTQALRKNEEYLEKFLVETQEKNKLLQKKEQELNDSVDQLKEINEDLQASEEELRQNTEELQTTYENLEQAKDEVEKLLQKENTQKKNLERTIAELKSTQSQLVHSEKMASIGQLTAGIAHEINNPINFVYAGVDTVQIILDDLVNLLEKYEELENADLVQEGALQEIKSLKEEIEYGNLVDDLQGIIKGIREGAVRTTEIVKGLRNFSRLDENELKKVNLHEGLDSSLVLLQHEIKNRLEVVKKYGELPLVDCYPSKINQVFMNALNNAIQAIEARREQTNDSNFNGLLIIQTEVRSNFAFIEIEDNGIGIDTKYKTKIFDPFFTTKEVGQGTGLGLSISYKIVENHQGKIEIDSELGQGTKFQIWLPLDKELN